MRRLRIALLLLLGLALCDATRAADQAMQLAPGERGTVELQENPSTGYRWQIDRNGSSNLAIIRISDRGFSAGKSKTPIGAPGVHRWTVEALSAGRARLLFVYMRPWERKSIRRHEVAIEVTKR